VVGEVTSDIFGVFGYEVGLALKIFKVLLFFKRVGIVHVVWLCCVYVGFPEELDGSELMLGGCLLFIAGVTYV
jgi:hypothetical protein